MSEKISLISHPGQAYMLYYSHFRLELENTQFQRRFLLERHQFQELLQNTGCLITIARCRKSKEGGKLRLQNNVRK